MAGLCAWLQAMWRKRPACDIGFKFNSIASIDSTNSITSILSITSITSNQPPKQPVFTAVV